MRKAFSCLVWDWNNVTSHERYGVSSHRQLFNSLLGWQLQSNAPHQWLLVSGSPYKGPVTPEAFSCHIWDWNNGTHMDIEWHFRFKHSRLPPQDVNADVTGHDFRFLWGFSTLHIEHIVHGSFSEELCACQLGRMFCDLLHGNETGRHTLVILKVKAEIWVTGLVLGLRPAHERRCYFVTPSLIGWVQA